MKVCNWQHICSRLKPYDDDVCYDNDNVYYDDDAYNDDDVFMIDDLHAYFYS